MKTRNSSETRLHDTRIGLGRDIGPFMFCVVRFMMRFEVGIGVKHKRFRFDKELVSRQHPVDHGKLRPQALG